MQKTHFGWVQLVVQLTRYCWHQGIPFLTTWTFLWLISVRKFCGMCTLANRCWTFAKATSLTASSFMTASRLKTQWKTLTPPPRNMKLTWASFTYPCTGFGDCTWVGAHWHSHFSYWMIARRKLAALHACFYAKPEWAWFSQLLPADNFEERAFVHIGNNVHMRLRQLCIDHYTMR